jgi:hypothetical protein
MKLWAIFLLLVVLTSCGYRTVPVYFSADAAVFSDTPRTVQAVSFPELEKLLNKHLLK